MANNHRTAHGALAAERNVTTLTNPYGLPLAPVRPERPSAPCDLADYGAGEEFRGWLVIFSRNVDFGVYRRAREVFQAAKEAQDASESDAEDTDADADAAETKAARGMSGLQVMDEVVAWLAEILLGWNFVDAAGRPLPQPRDGGAQSCPVAALPAIAKAFGKSSTPPKG